MRTVLFICTHNSARSQMAEGLVNALCSGAWKASSAGTEPGSVHPLAIEAMAEIGIDISAHCSKGLDEFEERRFDLVVTVCDSAAEACPFFPGGEMIHHSFADPSTVQGSRQVRLEAFRRTRDEIKAWISERFGAP